MIDPRLRRAGAFVLLSVLVASAPGADEDLVARARALAFAGDRAAALELLAQRLAADPDDSDALTLRGTVLSWEGRYDESRADLTRVLQAIPGHGDALPALINVEMWSGHPERALARAREGLVLRGENAALRLQEAKALHAQGSDDEALQALDRILAREPRHAEALALRESILASRRRYTLRLDHASDFFGDGRDPWHESSVALKRDTRHGPLIGRYSEARRFGERDRIFELEAYPRLRPGSYAYLGLGVAPDRKLYPRYRWGFDVYQSLPAAFEASLGYRRLGFTDAVNIYTGSVGLYRGNWYYTARAYVTPSAPGTSLSIHVTVRRYFGDGREYLGLRYGHGRSKEELRTSDDVALLGSDTVVADWNKPLGPRFEVLLRAGASREERVFREDLRRLSAQAALGWRF